VLNAKPFKLVVASSPDKHRPSHILLHAVQGWGKTSLAAQSPTPVFLMSKNETGLLTLIENRQVGPTPWIRFPKGKDSFSDEAESWTDVLSAVRALLTEDHPYKTLVLDTMNGLERLCHEYVCANAYKGDWGEKGFLGFQKGYDTALQDWRTLLHLLDRLRSERGMGTLALCHTQVKTQTNPLGPDYDRFVPTMHKKTWDLTHGWSDMCLFGRFEVEVDTGGSKSKTKGKGSGGSTRLLVTTYSAAWDAKNRHGLPEEIEVSSTNPQDAWADFMAALSEARG
jgi:hypothetical protein